MTRAIRPDAKRIPAPTPAVAKAWADHLGCSVAELRIAMRAVGTSVAHVQAYLDALKRRDGAAPNNLTSAVAPRGAPGQPSRGQAALP
jgi:hypothetical protein